MMAGKAIIQLWSQDDIQELMKPSIKPIALYVEMPETRHDIKTDRIKLNKIDAKRAGIIACPRYGRKVRAL